MDLVVEQYIPHRGRMKLVDKIIRVSENEALTLATVTSNWPQLPGGFVEAIMLVEVVAQSAGIHNEWLELQKDDSREPSKGWLVGIRDAVLTIPKIRVGTSIVTKTENTYKMEDFREIIGRSTINGRPAATVRLQIIQAGKPSPL